MTNWVRLWHDMPTDPKWRVIARRSGQTIAATLAVFNFVLVNASANANERGRTHNLFADDIAAALDMETENIEAILSAMQGKVLDGDYLSGWEKRQPKREDGAAERAKEWRERRRERKRTQTNAPERPDTDTDIDKKEPPNPLGGDAVSVSDIREAFEAYNLVASDLALPKARDLTDQRRRAIRTRLAASGGIAAWHEALGNIRRSDFLTGKTELGFRADLDFVCQAKSFQRLIEGYYANKGRGPPRNGNGGGMMAEVFRRLNDDDGCTEGEGQGDRSDVYPRSLPAPGARRN